MPANNRQSTSSALQTNAIWQTVVGYDPYKGTGEDPAGSAAAGVAGAGRKVRLERGWPMESLAKPRPSAPVPQGRSRLAPSAANLSRRLARSQPTSRSFKARA